MSSTYISAYFLCDHVTEERFETECLKELFAEMAKRIEQVKKICIEEEISYQDDFVYLGQVRSSEWENDEDEEFDGTELYCNEETEEYEGDRMYREIRTQNARG